MSETESRLVLLKPRGTTGEPLKLDFKLLYGGE